MFVIACCILIIISQFGETVCVTIWNKVFLEDFDTTVTVRLYKNWSYINS